MDPKHVPNLDWPTDLFRDAEAVDILDDPENPFWEPSDFTLSTEPPAQGDRIPCRAYAMAE